jgi:hypothetical protein
MPTAYAPGWAQSCPLPCRSRARAKREAEPTCGGSPCSHGKPQVSHGERSIALPRKPSALGQSMAGVVLAGQWLVWCLSLMTSGPG